MALELDSENSHFVYPFHTTATDRDRTAIARSRHFALLSRRPLEPLDLLENEQLDHGDEQHHEHDADVTVRLIELRHVERQT